MHPQDSGISAWNRMHPFIKKRSFDHTIIPRLNIGLKCIRLPQLVCWLHCVDFQSLQTIQAQSKNLKAEQHRPRQGRKLQVGMQDTDFQPGLDPVINMNHNKQKKKISINVSTSWQAREIAVNFTCTHEPLSDRSRTLFTRFDIEEHE